MDEYVKLIDRLRTGDETGLVTQAEYDAANVIEDLINKLAHARGSASYHLNKSIECKQTCEALRVDNVKLHRELKQARDGVYLMSKGFANDLS